MNRRSAIHAAAAAFAPFLPARLASAGSSTAAEERAADRQIAAVIAEALEILSARNSPLDARLEVLDGVVELLDTAHQRDDRISHEHYFAVIKPRLEGMRDRALDRRIELSRR